MDRCRGAEYPRVGLLRGAERNACVEHGVDIEIMAFTLAIEADLPSDLDAAHQPFDPPAQDLGPIKHFPDRSCLAEPGRHLAHGGPFGAFDAVHAVPFRISGDDGAALVGRDRTTVADFRIAI